MMREKGEEERYLCDLAWWFRLHSLQTTNDVCASDAREGEDDDGWGAFLFDILGKRRAFYERECMSARMEEDAKGDVRFWMNAGSVERSRGSVHCEVDMMKPATQPT